MQFSSPVLALLAAAAPMPAFGWLISFSTDTSCNDGNWELGGLKGTKGCTNTDSTKALHSWQFLPEGEKLYAIAYEGKDCSGGDTGPIHKQCLNSDMYTFGDVKSFKVVSG